MGDFLRLLFDALHYLWPFRIVKSYQRGIYYILGKPLTRIQPGLKAFIPFFTEVVAYDVNLTPYTLPRQAITLQDGTQLIVQALVSMEIDDIVLADTAVANYTESLQEISAAALADFLSPLTKVELEAKHRGRLLTTLKNTVDRQTSAFGCKCRRFSFVQFSYPKASYHVINDQSATFLSDLS